MPSVTGLLNRLSPCGEHYESLLPQVCAAMRHELSAGGVPRLAEGFALIHRKAVTEQSFTALYADLLGDLLRQLRKLVPTPSLLGAIHAHCAQTHRDGMAAVGTDAEAVKRLIGNQRFVGEMYNRCLVTSDRCLEMLRELICCCCGERKSAVADVPERFIDAACAFLKTAGGNLEASIDRELFGEIIARVEELRAGHPSSRVRYTLLNVVELRAAGWQPTRRSDVNYMLAPPPSPSTPQITPPCAPPTPMLVPTASSSPSSPPGWQLPHGHEQVLLPPPPPPPQQQQVQPPPPPPPQQQSSPPPPRQQQQPPPQQEQPPPPPPPSVPRSPAPAVQHWQAPPLRPEQPHQQQQQQQQVAPHGGEQLRQNVSLFQVPPAGAPHAHSECQPCMVRPPVHHQGQLQPLQGATLPLPPQQQCREQRLQGGPVLFVTYTQGPFEVPPHAVPPPPPSSPMSPLTAQTVPSPVSSDRASFCMTPFALPPAAPPAVQPTTATGPPALQQCRRQNPQQQQVRQRRGPLTTAAGSTGAEVPECEDCPAVTRTVYAVGIDSALSERDLLLFLSQCGQLAKARLCGDTSNRTVYGFFEYTTQAGAARLIRRTKTRLGSYVLNFSWAKAAIRDERSGLATQMRIVDLSQLDAATENRELRVSSLTQTNWRPTSGSAAAERGSGGRKNRAVPAARYRPPSARQQTGDSDAMHTPQHTPAMLPERGVPHGVLSPATTTTVSVLSCSSPQMSWADDDGDMDFSIPAEVAISSSFTAREAERKAITHAAAAATAALSGDDAAFREFVSLNTSKSGISVTDALVAAVGAAPGTPERLQRLASLVSSLQEPSAVQEACRGLRQKAVIGRGDWLAFSTTLTQMLVSQGHGFAEVSQIIS